MKTFNELVQMMHSFFLCKQLILTPEQGCLCIYLLLCMINQIPDEAQDHDSIDGASNAYDQSTAEVHHEPSSSGTSSHELIETLSDDKPVTITPSRDMASSKQKESPVISSSPELRPITNDLRRLHFSPLKRHSGVAGSDILTTVDEEYLASGISEDEVFRSMSASFDDVTNDKQAPPDLKDGTFLCSE